MEQIDFSQNLNTLGPAPKALEAARAAVSDIVRYPDCFSSRLKEAVAKELNIPDDCLTFGAGVTEICFNLPAVINQGHSLIPAPTFWEYEMANERYYGPGHVMTLGLNPDDNFRLDSEQFQDAVQDCSSAYICNPNNPTSQACTPGQIEQLVCANPDVDFVIDETYLYFLPDYKEQTVAHLLPDCSNLYILTSFSKFFAVPGARIGVLASSPQNIQNYESYRHPYSVTPVAEAVLTASIQDHTHIQQARATYGQLIQRCASDLPGQLDSESYQVISPEGPYVLIKILTEQTSGQITQILTESGLLVRDCSNMKGLDERWFRFALRKAVEQQQLINKLNQIAG